MGPIHSLRLEFECLNQWLVEPPLVVIHACKRLGKRRKRFLMLSCSTFSQVFTSYCSRCTTFWGARTGHPIMSQKCSIGERSADLAGQGKVLKIRRQSRDICDKSGVRHYLVGNWSPDHVSLRIKQQASRWYQHIVDLIKMYEG
ncbi:hypothetical protein TNCV_617561 [Trichonephila clavipes]|nr:hypothetical protein TNCV_617561 [Trichonephila clavipes]